jgi:uncharacterized membrane protein
MHAWLTRDETPIHTLIIDKTEQSQSVVASSTMMIVAGEVYLVVIIAFDRQRVSTSECIILQLFHEWKVACTHQVRRTLIVSKHQQCSFFSFGRDARNIPAIIFQSVELANPMSNSSRRREYISIGSCAVL